MHKIKIIFKIYCASSSFKIGFKVEGRNVTRTFKYISGCLSIQPPPATGSKLAQVPVALFNGLEYIFAFTLPPRPTPHPLSLAFTSHSSWALVALKTMSTATLSSCKCSCHFGQLVDLLPLFVATASAAGTKGNEVANAEMPFFIICESATASARADGEVSKWSKLQHTFSISFLHFSGLAQHKLG